jgi:hypothetical protein
MSLLSVAMRRRSQGLVAVLAAVMLLSSHPAADAAAVGNRRVDAAVRQLAGAILHVTRHASGTYRYVGHAENGVGLEVSLAESFRGPDGNWVNYAMSVDYGYRNGRIDRSHIIMVNATETLFLVRRPFVDITFERYSPSRKCQLEAHYTLPRGRLFADRYASVDERHGRRFTTVILGAFTRQFRAVISEQVGHDRVPRFFPPAF